MLNKYARAFFTRVLTPFAALLLRWGVSPDAVTLIGTAGSVAGALVFFPRGEFFWGTITITLFIFSDLVDGNMARQANTSSRWGAFLDSTLDRVADAAIFGGLALWYSGHGNSNVLCAVAVFCLASGQVVSYTKARGESLGFPVNVNGLVERAERLVITLVAAGVTGLGTFGVPYLEWLLPTALWVVAVGSLVTVFQRMLTVRRESREADAAAEATA
ncbi:phosphatidylinositol phosphate synthase [Kitasatospora sp. NPDC004289]